MSQANKLCYETNVKKSNNLKKKWTKSEVDFLKKEFKNGTKIKLIASKLGKTETAVNKFLTRCGIRPKTKTISRNKYMLSNDIKRHVKNSTTYPGWISLLNDFVDFNEVIRYLRGKNYNISSIVPEHMKLIYPNSQYMLNGQPVSKSKLLILANKLRENENKNSFKLDCIM